MHWAWGKSPIVQEGARAAGCDDPFPSKARRFGWLVQRLFKGTNLLPITVTRCDSLRLLGFPQSSGVQSRARRMHPNTTSLLRQILDGTHQDLVLPHRGTKVITWKYIETPTLEDRDLTARDQFGLSQLDSV